MVKHIYSTGIIYDRHLWSSKYFSNTGHWSNRLDNYVALIIAIKLKNVLVSLKTYWYCDIMLCKEVNLACRWQHWKGKQY